MDMYMVTIPDMHQKMSIFYQECKSEEMHSSKFIGFRGSKLWTNIDDAYKNRVNSTATFKKHYKNS